MALYQPTNVIPSSYTKGTVDAVNDKMEISWQVNGNSVMTAFQIDFYLNDANSTYVTSTGKKGTTPEEQKQLGLPFYGTDRFGRPQFFTWDAIVTWTNFNSGFTNGNEYKYKITQWYKGENEVAIKSAPFQLVANIRYAFGVRDRSGEIMGNVVFLLPRNFPTGTTIYYSFDADIGWMEVGSATTFISAQFYPKGGGLPADIIPFLDDPVTISSINESLTRQNFFSVFQTRTTPTLEIQKIGRAHV